MLYFFCAKINLGDYMQVLAIDRLYEYMGINSNNIFGKSINIYSKL